MAFAMEARRLFGARVLFSQVISLDKTHYQDPIKVCVFCSRIDCITALMYHSNEFIDAQMSDTPHYLARIVVENFLRSTRDDLEIKCAIGE